MDKDDMRLGTNTREVIFNNQKLIEQLVGTTTRIDIRETNPTGNFVTDVNVYIYNKENCNYEQLIAQFSLTFLPSCNWVCLFHEVVVYPTFRNKGLGKLLHSLRLEIAKLSKATLAMATMSRDNIREQGILERNGWIKERNFKRRDYAGRLEDDRSVTLWTKELY